MPPHPVSLGSRVVVKSFAPHEQALYKRELLALTLLEQYAPGLAPQPLPAPGPDGDGTAGYALRMTRVPGEPLRGTRIGDRQCAALAEAVAAVHAAVPAERLAAVPERPDAQEFVIQRLREWSAPGPGGDDPLVERAARAGLEWLEHDPPPPAGAGAAVFGPGDGNLANYLWDGTRVRIVDFEDCGRSDRAFELAEITEHVSAWSGTEFDPEGFIRRFGLSPAEHVRLAGCRRLLALTWLFMLSYDDPTTPRNPPGTAHRQAARVLDLLDLPAD